MNRQEQFQIIEAAKKEALKWAKTVNIALFRVEYVVPFVEDDFSLSTWFFFNTDEMVKLYEKNGISEQLKKEFLKILKSLGYPDNYIGLVEFIFDSDENVRINFEGSYFYRLR